MAGSAVRVNSGRHPDRQIERWRSAESSETAATYSTAATGRHRNHGSAAAPEDFDAISQALEENNIETVESEITMIPDTTVKVEGKDAEKMQTLIDMLEEHDDVQNVYTNALLSEEMYKGE